MKKQAIRAQVCILKFFCFEPREVRNLSRYSAARRESPLPRGKGVVSLRRSIALGFWVLCVIVLSWENAGVPLIFCGAYNTWL